MIAILLCYIGCTVEADDKVISYRIENTTNHRVELIFYKVSEDGQRTEVAQGNSDGPGTVFESTVLSSPGDLPPLPQTQNSDIAEFIFDNERIEVHSQTEPDRTIYSLSYENQSDNQVYIINEANFENATSCDGPCN